MSDVLTDLSLEALAAGYREDAFTPDDVLLACLTEVDLRNTALNAIVHLDRDGAERAARESAARWRAGAPLSPIDGAPIVVKANVAVAGMPWTAALKPFADRVATEDSFVVARLRAAGAVIVGIANMHEAALGATTTSPLYGPCVNPKRDGCTPGGSSGGSAAAVAAGLCVGAIGTDTMGSVRIPSAYCGVVGFKPSYGRVSRSGVIPLAASLDHVGFHARRVADVAALYSACVGFDSDDAGSGVFPTNAREPPSSNMCVGVLRTSVEIEPAVADAFEKALASLRGAAVSIVDIDLTELDLAKMRRRGLLICEAELLAGFARELGDYSNLSTDLAGMLSWAKQQSAQSLAEAYAERARAQVALRQAFGAADVLVSPTAPQAAFLHGSKPPANQADMTVLASFAGVPALCIPQSPTHDGLPASLQVMAPYGHDERALAFAEWVEQLDLK